MGQFPYEQFHQNGYHQSQHGTARQQERSSMVIQNQTVYRHFMLQISAC